MSYLLDLCNNRVAKDVILTEWTQSGAPGAQTLNSGDKIIYDTSRSTGSTGVSISGSGNMSFAAGKEYYLVMSVDVSRSDTSADFSFGYYDQSGTLLGAADGASESAWGVGLTATNISSTLQAVIIDTTQTYSIRCTVSSGTLTTETPSLVIMEVTRNV
jgi:hypothetical protein